MRLVSDLPHTTVDAEFRATGLRGNDSHPADSGSDRGQVDDPDPHRAVPKPARFNDIKRRLNGITHKGLTDALKRLERNGLVTRTVLPTAPIGVEYAITPLGRSLRQSFEALCAWALAYGPDIERAGACYDQGEVRPIAATGGSGGPHADASRKVPPDRRRFATARKPAPDQTI